MRLFLLVLTLLVVNVGYADILRCEKVLRRSQAVVSHVGQVLNVRVGSASATYQFDGPVKAIEVFEKSRTYYPSRQGSDLFAVIHSGEELVVVSLAREIPLLDANHNESHLTEVEVREQKRLRIPGLKYLTSHDYILDKRTTRGRTFENATLLVAATDLEVILLSEDLEVLDRRVSEYTIETLNKATYDFKLLVGGSIQIPSRGMKFDLVPGSESFIVDIDWGGTARLAPVPKVVHSPL